MASAQATRQQAKLFKDNQGNLFIVKIDYETGIYPILFPCKWDDMSKHYVRNDEQPSLRIETINKGKTKGIVNYNKSNYIVIDFNRESETIDIIAGVHFYPGYIVEVGQEFDNSPYSTYKVTLKGGSEETEVPVMSGPIGFNAALTEIKYYDLSKHFVIDKYNNQWGIMSTVQ